MGPRCETNLLKVHKKAFVDKSDTNSKWIELTDKQINLQIYAFSERELLLLFIVIEIGPEKYVPVFHKGLIQ